MPTMPSIPTGEFNPEKIAEMLYDNEEVRNPLFEAAYERYPDYDTEELGEAIDYILDGFRFEYQGFIESMPEDKWLEIEQYLVEAIDGGLT